MIRPGPPFGSFATLELANDRVRIIVCPALGARVLSLVDQWTGREWLVAGEPPPMGPGGDAPAWSGPDAVYGGSIGVRLGRVPPDGRSLPGSVRPRRAAAAGSR